MASWQDYAAVSGLVSREASTLGVLYRDVAGYPDTLRTDLRRSLRGYTTFLVDKVWPAQQDGRLLDEPTAVLTTIHAHLLAYQPPDSGATVMHAETMRKFNELVDLRRQRVDRVDEGLPPVLWVVVGIGALVTVAVRFFLTVENVRVHVVLLSLLATFVGLLIYQPYRVILERVMDPLDASPAGAPSPGGSP